MDSKALSILWADYIKNVFKSSDSQLVTEQRAGRVSDIAHYGHLTTFTPKGDTSGVRAVYAPNGCISEGSLEIAHTIMYLHGGATVYIMGPDHVNMARPSEAT